MKVLIATLLAAAALTACSSNPAKTEAPKAAAQAADTPTRSADGVLIGPDGKSLYVFAKDAVGSGASACYDQCAKNWPPLTAAPTAKPTGDYTIIMRTDGTRQWAYKGAPLYYFVKDAKAGDKSGDGVGGAWKLARP
jgi:predicted lipoprotein with Yx(FWY)xxD motif